MVHMAEDVNAFGVPVEQLVSDANRLAFLQFVEIADMNFGGEGRAFAQLRIVPADAEISECLVQRLVKKQMVICHIHMAIEIDPYGLNLARRAFNRFSVCHCRRTPRGVDRKSAVWGEGGAERV